MAPDGSPWNGDGGAYRLRKGVRIQADSVERAIVARVVDDLKSEAMAAAIAAHYRDLAKTMDKRPNEAAPMKRRIAEIDMKTSRLADLMSETSAPNALLRQIEAHEEERSSISGMLESMESDRAAAKTFREIGAADVRRMLHSIVDDMNAKDPDALRDTLRQALQSVELSAETFEAVINYRVGPASKSGELVASPRGFEPRLPL